MAAAGVVNLPAGVSASEGGPLPLALVDSIAAARSKATHFCLRLKISSSCLAILFVALSNSTEFV